jgi:putative transposase
MLLAHKIELRPTPEQIVYLDKACGSKRHCFNQLLAHFSKPDNKWSKNEAYPYYINVIRKEFDWYGEVSSRVTRNAIDDLDNAFKHFFRRVKAKQKAGFPRFKKKDCHDSFALRESAKFDVIGRELRIEKLKTKIEMRQPLRFQGTAKQVTISKRAGKYFASILVDTDDYNPNDVDRQKSVGVDFGIKELAVLSTGKVFAANQTLKASLRKLAKLQRNLAKKVKGSNHRAKAKLKIAKLHFRIANQRQALLHELSDTLTKNFDVITIEDLNVKG